MPNFEFIEPDPSPLPIALQLAQDAVAQTRAYHQNLQTRASQLADATPPSLTYAGQSQGQPLLRTPEGNLLRAGARDSNGALLAGVVDIVSSGGVLRVGGMPRVLPTEPLTRQETLDVYLLVDISGSFENDIATLKLLLDSLFNSLKSVQEQLNVGLLRFGLGTFSGEGDPVYTHRVPMTTDKEKIRAALNAIVFGGGNEQQLNALIAAAGNQDIGFYPGALKTIVLITDERDEGWVENDEPELSDVKLALESASIAPVFLVTEDLLIFWQIIQAEGELKGAVEVIAEDSSDLITALGKALGRIFA